MNFYDILGYSSTLALAVPVVVIVVLRLFHYNVFIALGAYYAFAFVYNLITNNVIHVPENYRIVFSAINNMLEAPLVLFFLLYFSPSAAFAQKIRLAIAALLAYALIVGIVIGFNRRSTVFVYLPGIILILGISIHFFVQKTKQAITNSKHMGKAIMIAGILFVYVSYAFLYVSHYLVLTPEVKDNFKIYYLSTTISALLVTMGILIERNRLKELREIQVTRKELARIYGDEEIKKAAPNGTASVWKEEF